ncbi:juvenile hormone acid O-methyltransferase [Stomoxys calcitrans]|uniref:juvenile hormone acid O-methyltransferase n=1 Tax=Stomoxys calcitrans TaxID=35570 RepID=UPI0027E304F1|nr:juvenile hormone acid O-methyltransferase [Stomoxys calcitrans]
MDNPELYHKTNQMQRHNAGEIVREYLQNFNWRTEGPYTLIDLGSSIGDVLLEVVYPILDRKFNRIVCSDINPGMIEYGKQLFGEKIKNSEFRVFDIATTGDIPSDLKDQFDIVVSFFCLQLIPDQRNALQNIYSLLRPEGGNCLLTIFARAPYFEAYLHLSKTSKWSPYMGEVDKYTCCWHYCKDPENELNGILEDIGFRDIDVKLRPTVYTYESFEAFKSNMKAVSHYCHRMPTSLQDEFISDFAEAMMRANPNFDHYDSDGKAFRLPFTQLVIFARK